MAMTGSAFISIFHGKIKNRQNHAGIQRFERYHGRSFGGINQKDKAFRTLQRGCAHVEFFWQAPKALTAFNLFKDGKPARRCTTNFSAWKRRPST
ncbi:hypothetical protein JXA32_02855 [Candidatus Sumerlaeota bacterium]|nr:hypothetical protein [Candidatus Sumerlaeota bacterium]